MTFFYIILGGVFFATFAMAITEGFWSNTVLTLQIALSGLVAFGWYQPLTIMIDEATGGEWTYWLDLVTLWGLFFVTMSVLKVACEQLSKTRLRFIPQVEQAMGPAMAAAAAYVMTAFTMATIHTAPLNKDCLGGQYSYSSGQEIYDADLQQLDASWLRFVEVASKLGLSSGEEFRAADFVDIYMDHREKYEENDSYRVDRG